MNGVDFISASIVTYNNLEKAKTACRSVLDNTRKYPLKLFVIDNASDDGTVDFFSRENNICFIKNDKNIGFGAAHNKVISEKVGKYHFVINPDIEIKSDVLSDMVDFMEKNSDVVMAMPQILNTDGTVQKIPKERPTFKRLYLGRLSRLGGAFKRIRDEYSWSNREVTDVTDIDFCSGCFFCIRSDVFKSLNGFDERYFMYMEDADLTMRVKGYGRVVILPDIKVTHLWERDSAKSLRYLMIHICSSFKFLHKWRTVK